jgi:hypothetical protein
MGLQIVLERLIVPLLRVPTPEVRSSAGKDPRGWAAGFRV